MNGFAGRFLWIIIPLVVWSLVWKGLALWTAARRGEKWWFVAFMLVNTVGALEIIYLLVLGKQERPSSAVPKP